MEINEGLSFDDVLLVPRYSEVVPAEVELTTQLTRNLTLRLPLLSAAMDTVTEANTAITMAQHGGAGIIHKNFSIADQAREVSKVKRSEAGLVSDPITISSHHTVATALDIMHSHSISGLPVVDDERLSGIVTGRDIRFESERGKRVGEVMTTQIITAPKGTTSNEALAILHQHRIEKLPLVDDGRLIGLFTIKDIEKARRFPAASKDSHGRLIVGAAVSPAADCNARVEALLNAGCDVLAIDTAHGHSKGVLDTIAMIKNTFTSCGYELIAGNIASAAAAQALIEAGADAIKVGVGPGSICTTRIVAGIGVPQLTAILNCARVAREHGVPVIADGGIRFSGDVLKACAAGAATVMVGSLFGGTDEAPGEMILYAGKTYKSYRGMGSIAAMQAGSKDRYQQEKIAEPSKLVPEGIEGLVPYSGSLSDNLQQLVGGLRSGMGYIGAKNIASIPETAEFVKISPAGLKESHVHDVVITREPPNYRR